jgi:hypothetical protein
MMPIQILGGLLLVGALVHVLLRGRARSLSWGALVFWIVVFGGILVVLLVPSVSGFVAHVLGVGRGADVIMYGSICLLFYLVFGIYVRIENLQRRMTRMLRMLALREADWSSPQESVESEAKDSADDSSAA